MAHAPNIVSPHKYIYIIYTIFFYVAFHNLHKKGSPLIVYTLYIF